MAIIYTYPTKATPNANDLILISDSQDGNKTKQVTIASLPGGSGSGVSSVTSANAAITVADAATTPVLTSVAYSGGTGIGHVPTGSGGSASVYLDGSGNWSTPTDTTYDVMGSGNSYAAGLVLAGNATHNDEFLRKNGTWAVPTNTTIDTKNSGSSVANPTTSLDFSTGLTATGGAGGSVGINFSGGLNDLSDVSFTATANGSLYVGQVNANATGLGNVTLGGGAGKVMVAGAADNTLIGSDAGVIMTEAGNNVVIGSDSAAALLTGDNNVLIGSDVAASLSTGGQNVIIGKNANVAAASVRSVVIGDSSSANNDSVVVGQGSSAASTSIVIGKDVNITGNNKLAIGAITLDETGYETQVKYLPIQIKNTTTGNMDQYYIKLWT